jgi:hypothetical protein
MKKRFKLFLNKIQKNSVVAMLMLAVVSIAEVSADVCLIWVLGQEDMPEELL